MNDTQQKTPIIPLLLWRSGFESEGDVWTHLSTDFHLLEQQNDEYFQFFKYSDEPVGIALKYYEDLQVRFMSFTGKELILKTHDEPDNAQ